jgi:uncharacterized membrane protein required for colicin V production
VFWLDTLILAVLLIGAIFGALSGLLWQVCRLASFTVAIYASIYLNDWARGVLQDLVLQGADPRVGMVLGYLVVFLVVYLILFAVTVLLERGMIAVCLQPVNRILGAGVGSLKAALLLGAIFLGMASYPHPSTQEMMDRSTLAPMMADGAQLAIVAVPQEYKDWLCSGLAQLRELTRTKVAALHAAPPRLPQNHIRPPL